MANAITEIRAQINRVDNRLSETVTDGGLRTDERQAALAVLREQKRDLEARLAELVDEAEQRGDEPSTDPATELRDAFLRAGALGRARIPGGAPSGGDGESWRALLPNGAEYRALLESDDSGDALVPAPVAAQYVDLLRNKTVFLESIPASNLVPFMGKSWTMPVLSDSDDAALTAEGAEITEGSDTFTELEFTSKKYASIRKASNEIVSDSAIPVRDALGNTMLRNLAAQIDRDAFNGDGSAVPVKGIISQGTSTASASTLPTHDDIADAIVRLWAANANPTVVWCAPDSAGALIKEREGTEGARLDPNMPNALALSLPIKVSSSVPAGNVVVADATRIFAGLDNARVAVSEHAAFTSDSVVYRITQRVAGIYVVEATSVQVLTPAAS